MSRQSKPVLILMIISLILTGCAATGPVSIPDVPDVPRNPKAAIVNVRLGINYMQMGKLPLANAKLKKALAQDPDSSLVNWTNAVLAEKLGETEDAEKLFRRAINLDKNDSEAHNNYGAFLCRLSRVDEALDQFNLAVANPLYQTPEYAYTNAGVCLVQQDRAPDAREYFFKALEKNSAYPTALYQMALLNYGEGRYARSHEYLQQLSYTARNNPKVLWLCAVTERQLGNMDASRDCAKQLRKNFPLAREIDRLP